MVLTSFQLCVTATQIAELDMSGKRSAAPPRQAYLQIGLKFRKIIELVVIHPQVLQSRELVDADETPNLVVGKVQDFQLLKAINPLHDASHVLAAMRQDSLTTLRIQLTLAAEKPVPS
jgi:hypothetical protein